MTYDEISARIKAETMNEEEAMHEALEELEYD